MKKIEVIIPTRNRLGRLRSALDTIPYDINVTIVCDGDKSTYEKLKECDRELNLVLVPEHRGTVFCRNLATTHASDGVLCAMDSVSFKSNAFQRALEVFNESFPDDDDGVFGFVFEGIGSCTALPLVGQKFLQRYPHKYLYYPGYFHFGCQEISSLCVRLKEIHKRKFFVRDQETLATKCSIRDDTYNDGRRCKSEDMKLKGIRESTGLIWGLP
jgi:hypothetical protein